MKRPASSARIHVLKKTAAELTDSDIQRLMAFGQREGDLYEEVLDARRNEDSALVWQITQTMVEVRDEALRKRPARKEGPEAA